MSTFKELIKQDISNVFMNLEEFSETATVDGKAVHIMYDKNELNDRKPAGTADGLYTGLMLVYIPVGEYGPAPAINKIITINGKQYQIRDCINEDGIYSMTIERYSVR